MKRLLLTLAVMFLCCGCAADPIPETAEPPAVTEPAPVAPTPAEPEPEEPPAVEIPVEMQEEPEEAPETVDDNGYLPAPADLRYEDHTNNASVEESVGYSITVPYFLNADVAAEEMNRFYTELGTYLSNYAAGGVYTEAMDRHCIADVVGTYEILGRDSSCLVISYTLTVSYSDSDEPEVSVRTDKFDLLTGQAVIEQ